MAPVLKTVNVFYIALLPVIWNRASAIDCYDCNSFNNSDPTCGDPFHPAYGELKRDCQQGKDGFIGLYPAKYCIKLIGTIVEDDIEMVYRGCSLDDLDNQCGDFKFEGVRYRGCMMSCTENACNGAVNWSGLTLMSAIVMTLLLFISAILNL